jgi:hypothetical protein
MTSISSDIQYEIERRKWMRWARRARKRQQLEKDKELDDNGNINGADIIE